MTFTFEMREAFVQTGNDTNTISKKAQSTRSASTDRANLVKEFFFSLSLSSV
jgi:hypothetical protein